MEEVWQHLTFLSKILKQNAVTGIVLGGLTVIILLQSMSSGGSTLPDIWLKTALLTFCNEENHQSNLNWLLFPSSKLCSCHLTTVFIQQKMCNFFSRAFLEILWTGCN